ncbi:MAG: cytochrome c biogenesis protein CcdA, partial [Bacteroidota bacterium]
SGLALKGTLSEKDGKPETYYDDIYETEITIFHDNITFVQEVVLEAGSAQLDGYLRYQICDDSRCIPGSLDISESFEVAKKKSEPAAFTPEASISPISGEQPTTETPPSLTTSTISPLGAGNTTDLLSEIQWVQTYSSTTNWKTGDTITLSFSAEINPDHYIYSTNPSKDPSGIPTEYVLDESSKGITLVGGVKELQVPEKKYDEVFETEVAYFKDKAAFEQKILITEDAPVLSGALIYQICNEAACVNGKVETAYGEDAPTQSVSQTSPVSPEPTQSRSLWRAFLEGFLFGFASLLTPCIFPLIPLTVSYFTKQSENRAEGIRNGVTYGLSIVVIYTVIGLLVTVLLGGDVMRQLSVSPTFNLILFTLIFVFALSFLGLFEITLPSSWSTNLKKGSERGGFVGIFLMALALAVVSFSCTGPLVSTALFEAASGESYLGPTVSMLAFSSAIAIPFSLFAIFPGWLNSLPKSGGWLNSVKVVLGFLELALSLIYLSRADLVMHWGLLDRDIFIGAWIVIFGLMGVYLLGKLQLPHDSPVDRISVPRLLMAMGSFWFMLYLLPGLWGAPLNMLGGYIPEDKSDMGVILQSGESAYLGAGSTPSSTNDICTYPNKVSGHLAKDTPDGFCAFYDLEQGLAYAKSVNKPVFLDFTGHTCANCRYLEKNMWIDPEVRKYINEEYVLISLYTDDREKLPNILTTEDGKKIRTVGDQWIQYQIETYNSNAQPFYVLMDHEKQNLLPPTGYTPPLNIAFYQNYFREGVEVFQKKSGKTVAGL